MPDQGCTAPQRGQTAFCSTREKSPASSRFFADIRAAVRIFRETRFNLLLPASAFALSEESRSALSGETLFVQGVIDIFFETADGRTVLCDYKTDRMPDGILADPAAVRDLMFERHGNQLGYYAASVRRLTGRYPDDVLVFPLQFGEAVRLDMIGPDSPLSLDQ